MAEETPSDDRMNELWREMFNWPPVHLMSFAMQLAHAASLKIDQTMIDAAIFDPKAQQPLYIVFARGDASNTMLRRAVSLTCTGRGERGNVLQKGEQGLSTPLSAGA